MYQLLSGVRILDLTRLLPGGFASQLLADLGATVLKVEDPVSGDYLRWMKPYLPGTKESALYWSLNRNKQSIKLDLKSKAGHAAFLRLLSKYDIVLEGFRPGVMDSLGLSYQVLKKINPALILCSISGYGQDGPYRLRSGHDINYMALSGALGLTGQSGGPPVSASVQVADIGGGGLMAVIGILSAYIDRQKTGKGQYIDVSMLDGAVAWMTMLYAQQAAMDPTVRRGTGILNGGEVCYRVYETKDGRFMSLGALEVKFWQAFCQVINRPDLMDKQFTRDSKVLREVEEIFKSKTQQEWVDFFRDRDVCCEPVLELGEALEHPQLKARGVFTAFTRSDAQSVQCIRNPLRFPEEQELPDHLPPDFGEQTLKILQAEGFTETELKQLIMNERSSII